MACAVLPSVSRAQAPVFEITLVECSIKFDAEASVSIKGAFDKWDATLTFTSPDLSTGRFRNQNSRMKNGKLKGKDFFDVEWNPLITFTSTKIVQSGSDTLEVDGNFTIRGISKPEKLTLAISGKGTGSGTIKGTMAFDRKDYGMNKGIPFIKIANRVEVYVDLSAKRVSGPPVTLNP